VLAHIVGDSDNKVNDMQEKPLESKGETCGGKPIYKHKNFNTGTVLHKISKKVLN